MTRRAAGSRLTAREREIAHLLGLGLTNKEIAVRLKISRRTADTHVQNMLNKLGAGNRAQIVALVSETAVTVEASAAARPAPALPAPTPGRLWLGRAAVLAAGAVVLALILSADQQTSLMGAAAISPDRAIVDDFTSPDVDSSTWDISDGPSRYVFQGRGHLAVYIGADAGQVFEAGVTTVCQARGDFDAQVSFELVTWTKQDALSVSLMGAGTPFNTYRTNREPSDSYGAYLPPAGREVRATGLTGSLRLTRTGPRWSGYYLANNRWSLIASGDGGTGDIGIRVIVFNGDVAQFGGKEALVYFKNFRVTATKVVCP